MTRRRSATALPVARGARVLLAVALGGPLLVGCDESWIDELPEPFWENEDFRVATAVDGPICSATLDFQAGFVDRLQEVFGQPRDGRRFTYYVLPEEFFEDGICGEKRGCYSDRILVADVLLNLHELVHAIVDAAIGRSHPFLNEGIAEVFRDRHLGAFPVPFALSLQEALEEDPKHSPHAGDVYARSGHFMAYVLDVHGPDVAAEMLDLARPGDSSAALRAALGAATGLGFDELAADYASYPECTNRQYRWPIMECSFSTTAWNGCAWEVHVPVDCGLEGALGPRDGEVWTVRVVDIPAEADYRLVTFGDPAERAYVEVGGCTVGCAPGKYLRIEQGTTVEAHLSAGLHYVSLVRSEVQPGRSGVRIEPVDSAETTGCAP